MKALWIRVEAHEVDSVRIARFAEQLEIDVVTAFGHYVALGGAVAEHTDDGHVAGVPNAALERWGRWKGKPGRFAAAVREVLQSEAGEYANWLAEMGELVKRRERDRRRKVAGDSTDDAGSFRGNSTEIPRNGRADSRATERNGTGRDGTSRDLDQERSQRRNGTAPPASAAAETATAEQPSTSPTVLRWYRQFYDHAPVRRSADVRRQLAQLLTSRGAPHPYAPKDASANVRAITSERLDRICREMMAEGVKDPDKAIVVLLLKLVDTSDVTEGHAAAERSEADADDAERRARLVHAEAWIRDHPEIAATIARVDTASGAFARAEQQIRRESQVLALWDGAGSPLAEAYA